MSDNIPPGLIDKMMVKCARRCCICRRFRPTKLQVHHIVERNQGGSNDEDNLIVTCMSCHTDVHSKVPFARRFSVEELKGHRDALVRMLEQDVLPAVDTDDADAVLASLVQTLRSSPKPELELLPEAVELLIGAVQSSGNGQGDILLCRNFQGVDISLGGGHRCINVTDQRLAATYKQAVEQLVTNGLVERLSSKQFEVTYEGYLAADEIMVTHGQLVKGR